MAASPDQAAGSRQFILSEVLRQPGISRTDIAKALGLTLASVSRITRDLIEAGLVQETELYPAEGRPGRRFVGLAPRGEGGFIVGIGINAFRQSVTLADLENNKIAEWIAPQPPGPDGIAFLQLCLDKAAEMVTAHVPDRRRFFGAGLAVAAELDQKAGVILSSPALGWSGSVPAAEMTARALEVPLVMEAPSSAINTAEAECGLASGFGDVVTLHCSLGFGMGVRKRAGDSLQDFGQVLTTVRAPDGSGRGLDAVCGGLSVLRGVQGEDPVSHLSNAEASALLEELVTAAATDPALAAQFSEKGRLTAENLSLVVELLRPEKLLLAGPMAQVPEYLQAFRDGLGEQMTGGWPLPEVQASNMTPTGASRWLALRGTVAMGHFDLIPLKEEGGT